MALVQGPPDVESSEFALELLGRLQDATGDAVAFSHDRHLQVRTAIVLARAMKLRFGKPILLRGANAYLVATC